MKNNDRTFLSWSSGKDSAFALDMLNKNGIRIPDLLLTAVDEKSLRVPIHQIPVDLIKEQFRATGVKGEILELPANATNREYEHTWSEKLTQLRGDGYRFAAFGDIFLEDIKVYREKQYSGTAIRPIFPIWGMDSHEYMHNFIDLGFRAVVVSLDLSKMDASFLGREIDHAFLNDLPPGVDPAGENGEFHTFCFDGPCFKKPVLFEKGDKSTVVEGSGPYAMEMAQLEIGPLAK
ncbi:MAG: adenine nucleotide alpha hydrolase [Saprospirales bacterium]|nr:MAG: adenine nucleotide alpha hydrolase [Saprospirales bacterium]